MTKKILITGSSGGFGKLTALTLLQKGHCVAASMRDINGKNKSVADELRNAGAIVLEIDVTNDTSVTNGVQMAISELKGFDIFQSRLRLLIEGVGVLGKGLLLKTGGSVWR